MNGMKIIVAITEPISQIKAKNAWIESIRSFMFLR